MKRLTVDIAGQGDFITLGEALNAVPANEPLEIFVCRGVYHEKLFCDRTFTRIVGEGSQNTVITWADGAWHTNADGQRNGTFRSYTLWLGGGRAELANLTVENTCGDGDTAGQGIALAADAEEIYLHSVTLRGCQDTLYTGPLPEKERIKNGFLGPRQSTIRIPSRQYYLDCTIEGDIDFIFGGADAVFEDCLIICRDRGQETNGYIAAPATPWGGTGYIFYRCTVEGTAPCSFYLARPWREYGRAVFAQCRLGSVIKEAGWDNWGEPANEQSCFFAEYDNIGEGAYGRRAFGYLLDPAQFVNLMEQVQEMKQQIMCRHRHTEIERNGHNYETNAPSRRAHGASYSAE